MQTRGGNVSTSLNATLWAALEKYLVKHPGETRGSVLRAALRAYLKLDK